MYLAVGIEFETQTIRTKKMLPSDKGEVHYLMKQEFNMDFDAILLVVNGPDVGDCQQGCLDCCEYPEVEHWHTYTKPSEPSAAL